MAQNQNRVFQSCLPQLHGLQNGADSKKGTLLLQQPGDLNRAMTIGICLDHRQNGHAHLLPNPVNIPFNDIQVNFHPGIIVIQAVSSRLDIVF